MTELGGIVAVQPKDRKRIDSIGHIIDTVQMKVIDPSTNKTLGKNKSGELCFRSRSAMLGYHHDSDQSRAIIDERGMKRVYYFMETSKLIVKTNVLQRM